MMLKATIAAALAVALIAPAGAQTFSTSTSGYSGSDAVKIDFDSPLPNGFSLEGGRIATASTGGLSTQPLGSTGNYLTSDIGSAVITSTTGFDTVNFLWGSIDTYNIAKFYDAAGALIGQLTGSDVAQGQSYGDLTTTDGNRYVTFSVDPATNQRISKVALTSSDFSMETDNFSFYNKYTGGNGPVPVPEPGTMLLFALAAAALMFADQRRTSLVG